MNLISMKIIDSYRFGDIVAATIPFSDGGMTKVRPVFILNKDKNDYLTIRMTSNIANKDSYDIEVIPDGENNLRISSLIKIKKISCFAKELFLKKIGRL